MKRRVELLKLTSLIALGVMVGGIVLVGGDGSDRAGALSYQSPNIGIKFTFDPTLSIDVSADLVINSLMPGNSSDSNVVNVGVATNAAYGYTLSAEINSEDLTRGSSNDKFSSVGVNANFSDLEDFGTNAGTNTWGYSYKDNSATTPVWSNYSGLATGISKVLLETDSNNTETGVDSADFKIAAKAGSTQPSGVYTGTIVFTAVTKFKPKVIDDLEYLQDFADLDETDLISVKNSMPAQSTYTLKDNRDKQEYTIVKLSDDKIWMTKNLNLAGGTALSADDTDVSGSYISSFSTSNNLAKTDDTIVLPASSTSGFNSDNYSFVYNSQSETCGNNSPCYSYYSWDAATLGSGRSISTNNANAPYSICPKGWKLPSTYDGSGTAAKATDFRALMIALGGSNSVQIYNNNTTPKGSELYALFGPNTTPNFLLAGYYGNGSFYSGGDYGNYWSSTSGSNSSFARFLFFFSPVVNSASGDFRSCGYSVRCLAE